MAPSPRTRWKEVPQDTEPDEGSQRSLVGLQSSMGETLK
jgi:hypothetical protein